MMLQPLDGADRFAGVLILQFFFMEDGFVLGLSAYGTTHGRDFGYLLALLDTAAYLDR